MTLTRPDSLLAGAVLVCSLSMAAARLQAQQTAAAPPAAAGVSDSASLPDAPSVQQSDANTPTAGQQGAPSTDQKKAQAAPAGQTQPGAALQIPNKTAIQRQSEEGKQTKRILYIVPNFRSVSVDEKVPPQGAGEKFRTATLDSLDYSSFIFVGIQAGIAQASNSYPEFHQGAAGYGRYYWHTLADSINENLWVEFLLPTPLHQDPRFYTLGRGGFPKRLAYSITRTVITRTDSGGETFNTSEVVGAGAASAVSSLWYPTVDRTWTKIGQRWLTNVLIDGGTFAFKEFWPDLNSTFFHQRD